MRLGYARVSTEEQELALQLDALEAAGCDQIFQDEGFSGALTTRPGLMAALAALKPGDVLTVWRLDCLGRSLQHLIQLLDDIGRAGAGFHSITEAIDTTTAGGKLVFHMIGAMAEFERSVNSERTRAGMKAARRRGKALGRPAKLTDAQIAHARRMVASGEETVTGMAELYSVDRTTMHKALKKRLAA